MSKTSQRLHAQARNRNIILNTWSTLVSLLFPIRVNTRFIEENVLYLGNEFLHSCLLRLLFVFINTARPVSFEHFLS